jgi:hypothetical protein
MFTYDAFRPDREGGEVYSWRVCRKNVKDGQACRDEKDCGDGRCFCTGALSGPNPGSNPKLRHLYRKPAVGTCNGGPISSGEWRCLVIDGKAELYGIIVD